MPSINRGTLPQNFLDSVSQGMTLPTPEPQYAFARMAIGQRLSLAAIDAGATTTQQFVTSAGNGAIQDPSLDNMVRSADLYQGAIIVVDDIGKGRGDTIKFPRDIFEGGGYDQASRELKTDAVISTTAQTIKNEEVPIVLKEFTGPYNLGAGATQPYAIYDFDVKHRKNKVQLASKVTRHLRRDYTKWLDRVIRGLFLQSPNVTLPTNVANVATDLAPGMASGISLEQVFRAKERLSKREWQKFPTGRYQCLVPTSFNTQMIADPDYKELSKTHADGRNLIYGYIGSVQDVDFYECTTLATYSDNLGDDLGTINVNGSVQTVGAGYTLDEAILFGPGTIGMGTGADPECRWADDTNYGTVAKVIWYGVHAFECLDTRGIERIVYQGIDA